MQLRICKAAAHLAAVRHAKEWPFLFSVAQQDSCHSQESFLQQSNRQAGALAVHVETCCLDKLVNLVSSILSCDCVKMFTAAVPC